MGAETTGTYPRIDDAELARLIEGKESTRVELKETLGGNAPGRIREAICAFANDLAGLGQLGLVAVGLSDDGVPVGLAVTDEMLRVLTDMRGDGNILPPPMLLVEKRLYLGNELVVVTVLPSDSPPVRCIATTRRRTPRSASPGSMAGSRSRTRADRSAPLPRRI